MLNVEIINILSRVQREIDIQTQFVEFLDFLSKNQIRFEESLVEIGKGGPSLSNLGPQIHAELAALVDQVTAFSSRKFFTSADVIKNAFLRIKESEVSTPDLVLSAEDDLEKFLNIYDVFLSSQRPHNLAPLIFQATKLKGSIDDFRRNVDFLNRVMIGTIGVSSDELGLTFYAPNTVSLEDFIGKLLALKSMYSELCQLLSVSQSENPLRIGKIESGSFWASLIGKAKIIGLMADFLRGSALYLKRNYTNEGQIEAIPAKLASLDKVLGFSQKMKKAGLDVTGMDEELAKAGHAIAKDLTRLLSRQSSVVINTELIDIGSTSKSDNLQLNDIPKLGSTSSDSIPRKLR